DATRLSSVDIELIIQKISKKYPYFAKQLKVISSAIPFTKLIILNKDQFYDLYLNVGDKFRSKYFNYKLPQRTLTKIFTDKEKFNKFLKLSLINPNLNQLHKSLLKINDSKLNENSSFLLALNAVRYNDLILANKYLKNAIKKDKENKNKDKYNFWLYKINKNKDILVNLSNSFDFNLYSIYSDELLQKYNNYDIYLDDIKLINNYEEKYDINRVALLYSIAKIKSGFNSSKISKIFELGIMQLKPNLIKNISKKLNKEYNILNQFRIEDSLKYTNIHINNLEGKFNNPLEIFLNYKENIETSLENEKFFNINNPYEPFISIELLSFDNILLKDFILYYYLYYNNFLENYEELTFSSIFEELLSNDQN
ncbi:MAG: transglycosylase SLT domain-containing protein, partial [Arcobacter sp.]|nr:transglycosylase SLT domain-containing protein [Arcobacter sp.]